MEITYRSKWAIITITPIYQDLIGSRYVVTSFNNLTGEFKNHGFSCSMQDAKEIKNKIMQEINDYCEDVTK